MLTPMMSAYLLKAPKKRARRRPLDRRSTSDWMRWCLRHRVLTTIGALVFFFGSLALVPLLPTGFIPPDDLSQTQVQIALPPGATFEQTNADRRSGTPDRRQEPVRQADLHDRRRRRDRRRPVHGRRRAEVRKATLTLNLTPRSERGGVKKQVVEQQLRDALVAVPGARINVGFGGSNEKYTLVLAGEDGAAARRRGAPRRAGAAHAAAASATSPRPRAWCGPS